MDMFTNTNSVERYDIAKDTWTEVPFKWTLD